MSDTPRTDALDKELMEGTHEGTVEGAEGAYLAMRDHAKKLECEITALHEVAEAEALDNLAGLTKAES